MAEQGKAMAARGRHPANLLMTIAALVRVTIQLFPGVGICSHLEIAGRLENPTFQDSCAQGLLRPERFGQVAVLSDGRRPVGITPERSERQKK